MALTVIIGGNPMQYAVQSGCSAVHGEAFPTPGTLAWLPAERTPRHNLKRRSPGTIGVAWTGYQTNSESEQNRPFRFKAFDGTHEAAASLSGHGDMEARYARQRQRARFFIS